MSLYIPDTWVILKITQYGLTSEVMYKVLAGWNGSYLGGVSWRMNSGITGVTEIGAYYEFHGSSGSRYQCFKESYRLSMAAAGVYNKLKDLFDEAVEIVPENTKWSEIDW